MLLIRLLGKASVGLQANDHIVDPGDVVFRHACQLGFEGIVSKRLGSPYRSGRSRHWIKTKNQSEVEVTNDRPWRLADLSFVPSGNGRERATINGVEVVRENGRYWIITPNGPLWSNIDERGVDPALNYLFEKRRQEQQLGQ